MPPDAEAAWIEVADQVHRHLVAALRGDAATADDLTQEVFLRLRRALPGLRSLAALPAWTRHLTRSVLIDHLRRRRDLLDVDQVDPPAVAGDASTAAASGLARFARAQVEVLPASEAAAIRLVDLDGITPADAAAALAITPGALKARLHRGRARLRQAIDRCCAITLDGRGHPAACEPHPHSPCTTC